MKFSKEKKSSNEIMLRDKAKKVNNNVAGIERAPSVKPLLPPKPSNSLKVSVDSRNSKSESASPTIFPSPNSHSNGQLKSDIVPPVPVRSARDSSNSVDHSSRHSTLNNSSQVRKAARTKSVSPTQHNNSMVTNCLYSPFQPSIPPRNELTSQISPTDNNTATRPKTPPRNGNTNHRTSLAHTDSSADTGFCTAKRGDSTVSSGASSIEFLPLTAPRKSLNKVPNRSVDYLNQNSSTEFNNDDLTRLSASESCMTSSATVSTLKMTRKVFLEQIEQYLDHGDPRKWLFIKKEFPRDSTSTVCLAEDTRCPANSPQRQVVVKKICYSSAPRLQSIYNEVAILRTFPHEHIIKVYGVYVINNEVWILMEYAANDTLADLIQKKKEAFSEELIARILYPIVSALVYLHSNGIVHRDIRSDSILIMADGSAKLSDFSISAQIYPEIPKRKTLAGSPYWMAPEIISRWPYDCSADIWSLGITALEMINGKPPNFDMKPCTAMSTIRDNKFSTFNIEMPISSGLQEFLDKSLQYLSRKRASATDLLSIEFLKQGKLKRGSSLNQSLI